MIACTPGGHVPEFLNDILHVFMVEVGGSMACCQTALCLKSDDHSSYPVQ